MPSEDRPAPRDAYDRIRHFCEHTTNGASILSIIVERIESSGVDPADIEAIFRVYDQCKPLLISLAGLLLVADGVPLQHESERSQ